MMSKVWLLSFALLACIVSGETAFAQEWDWVECFDNEMDAWTCQVPGSWHATNGRLEYATPPGAHNQLMCVRYDEYLSLAEGFVIELTVDNSQMGDVQSVGIMFGANNEMSDIWCFDVGATFQYSHMRHLLVGNVNYGYGMLSNSPDISPFVMRVEYDGTILSSFIDGSPWISVNVQEMAAAYGDVPIPDGYVGIWCTGQDYPMWVDDFKFRSIPESVTLQIQIDIKPGSCPNPINLASKGVIPVAVLGGEEFDVTQIDQETLEFAGARPRPKGKSGNIGSVEDVNDDGFDDFVVHFPTQDLELDEDDEEATLIGELFDGTQFEGTDSVQIVGNDK